MTDVKQPTDLTTSSSIAAVLRRLFAIGSLVPPGPAEMKTLFSDRRPTMFSLPNGQNDRGRTYEVGRAMGAIAGVDHPNGGAWVAIRSAESRR